MEIIIHRVNKIKKLLTIPKEYGTEIDIRTYKNRLILSHDPFKDGDLLEDYLKKYKHGTLVLNIKESGIENDVIKLVKRNKLIKSFFLLDVEIPYLFKCLKNGEKNIALRTSYYEPLKGIKNLKKNFNWIWIDTVKKLNFTKSDIKQFKNFKKCLVCPERWGKASEIKYYSNYFKKKGIKLDAVMTSSKYVKKWKDISS